MRRFATRVALLSSMAFLGGLAGVSVALWSSAAVTAFTGATLAGGSTRVDTIVVSDVARDQKPDQYVLSLAGTTQATAADSQFSAVVKSIANGAVKQIGEDSLMVRPEPATAGDQVGEDRVLRWVADSLQVTTRNPMSQSVTGASFTATAQRTAR